MIKINLSYVLTTYNKFAYLNEVIKFLIQECKGDEEIIVVDGGSTDGTVELLSLLFEEGKIHQLVSERDFGEAHGFNKGILIAKGEIIKLMTDDDVFDFEIIRKCKEYLIQNPNVDVMFANTASINSALESSDLIMAKNYQVWFENWKNGNSKNCFICCLPLIVRRRSFTYIGLFDTSFKHADFEYSVRLTSKKVNVAFCTGLMVCAVMNVNSISYREGNVVDNEIKRVSGNYDYIYPVGPMPILIKKKSNRFYNRLHKMIRPKNTKEHIENYPDFNYPLEKNMVTAELAPLHKRLTEIMRAYNENNKPAFLENIKY